MRPAIASRSSHPPAEPQRERLTAQLLAGPPAGDPVAVAERLLAIQGQDPRGARLAIRARSSGLTAADVDRALTEDRSLAIATLNRGTLHLVRKEDYPWLQALTAPTSLAGNARRLAEEGVEPAAAERGLAAIERALADEGPLTRDALCERIAAAGVRSEGQALAHLIMRSSLCGLTVRGPMVAGAQAFALVRDWLDEQPAVDRDAALAELARRYLAGHGPASERDLARWSGLGLRDVRAGLGAIAGELAARDDGLLDLAGRKPPAPTPPPRLLGAFDPLLHGWESREPIVGEHRSVVTVNGLFRPFALVDGRAAGIWRLLRGRVELEPFEPLDPEVAAALDEDAAAVARYLGG